MMEGQRCLLCRHCPHYERAQARPAHIFPIFEKSGCQGLPVNRPAICKCFPCALAHRLAVPGLQETQIGCSMVIHSAPQWNVADSFGTIIAQGGMTC